MQTVEGVDDATRRAWEAGPFAAILRAAQEDRERKSAEAKARPALSAAVFVDEDVSRDSVEREALKHLTASAPDAATGDALLRHYASKQLRKTFRGVDWDHFDDLAYGPRLRQLPLPRPVGNGKDLTPTPKKPTKPRPARAARPKFDYTALTPLPGWTAYAQAV